MKMSIIIVIAIVFG